MNILVFGSTGSIGSHICLKLQEKTINVINVIKTTSNKEKSSDRVLFINNNNLINLSNIDKLDCVIWANGINTNDNNY